MASRQARHQAWKRATNPEWAQQQRDAARDCYRHRKATALHAEIRALEIETLGEAVTTFDEVLANLPTRQRKHERTTPEQIREQVSAQDVDDADGVVWSAFPAKLRNGRPVLSE